MKRSNCIWICLFAVFRLAAQSDVPAFVKSTLIVTSETAQGKPWKLSVDQAYMILNTSDGSFVLNADLSSGTCNDRKLDSLLKANAPQSLSFKGNIGENLILFNEQQNDERTYPMSGTLSLNDNAVACIAQFDPINAAEKSDSKNYRMDLVLSVEAAKLPVPGLEGLFTRQFVVEIVAGKLNVRQ